LRHNDQFAPRSNRGFPEILRSERPEKDLQLVHAQQQFKPVMYKLEVIAFCANNHFKTVHDELIYVRNKANSSACQCRALSLE